MYGLGVAKVNSTVSPCGNTTAPLFRVRIASVLRSIYWMNDTGQTSKSQEDRPVSRRARDTPDTARGALRARRENATIGLPRFAPVRTSLPLWRQTTETTEGNPHPIRRLSAFRTSRSVETGREDDGAAPVLRPERRIRSHSCALAVAHGFL